MQFIEHKNKENSALGLQNAKRGLRTDVHGLSDIYSTPAQELCARLWHLKEVVQPSVETEFQSSQ